MMVPARNLLRRHYNSYGGHFGDIQSEFQREKASSLPGLMAEEVPDQGSGSNEEEGEEAGPSSKEGDRDNYQGWLQLGIGSRPSGGSSLDDGDAPANPTNRSTDRSRGEAVELNLFSDRSSAPQRPPLPVPTAPTVVPLFPAVAVGYRSAGAMASSSLRQLPTVTTYNWGQFVCPSGSSLGLPVEIGGAMRVVSPPARQHMTGVWFLLQAAQNQGKEPFLPQIPKSYIRIKDGRMTVGLLMKYLAEKLGLDETQVVITCRGQQLPPPMTVQYVRDQIWGSRETVVELLPSSPSSERIMSLQYSRSR